MDMKAWTRRDLTLVDITEEKCMVISCDSCGAIGDKPEDFLKVSPRHVAKLTARVALTEVLCTGAIPTTITNGVSCEMQPTGAQTILGIEEEIKNADLVDVVLTGSTEENFQTNMTALAITVIGVANKNELKFGQALKGDKIILLGTPKLGAEVDLESKGFYAEIKHLLQCPDVREIVPIGSKGITHELKILATLNALTCELFETEIDYDKSAGPATCLLILCAESAVEQLLENYQNMQVIGTFTERT